MSLPEISCTGILEVDTELSYFVKWWGNGADLMAMSHLGKALDELFFHCPELYTGGVEPLQAAAEKLGQLVQETMKS